MRIVARQIWWLQVLRIAIGCATVAMGVLTIWRSLYYEGLQRGEWQTFRAFFVGGMLFILFGALFAFYARLQWRPRGFAVGMTHHGLVLKANGFRCPKLVRIKWSQIRGAIYEPPRPYSLRLGTLKIFLNEPLVTGTLPTGHGGVIELGPYTLGLNGYWEEWHPANVADLILSVVNAPRCR